MVNNWFGYGTSNKYKSLPGSKISKGRISKSTTTNKVITGTRHLQRNMGGRYYHHHLANQLMERPAVQRQAQPALVGPEESGQLAIPNRLYPQGRAYECEDQAALPQGDGYLGQGQRALPPGDGYQGQGHRALPPGDGYQGQGQRALPPGDGYHGQGQRALPPGDGYQGQGQRALPPGDGYHGQGQRALPPGDGYQGQGQRALPPGDGYHGQGQRALPPGDGYQGQGQRALPPGDGYPGQVQRTLPRGDRYLGQEQQALPQPGGGGYEWNEQPMISGSLGRGRGRGGGWGPGNAQRQQLLSQQDFPRLESRDRAVEQRSSGSISSVSSTRTEGSTTNFDHVPDGWSLDQEEEKDDPSKWDWSYGEKKRPLIRSRPAYQQVHPFQDKSINFHLAPGDRLIKCPYSDHAILEARLTTHLTKCMKSYALRRQKNPNLPEFAICKYNWKHHLPVIALAGHLEECESRPDAEERFDVNYFEKDKADPVKKKVKEEPMESETKPEVEQEDPEESSTNNQDEEDWDLEAKKKGPAPSFDIMEHIQKLETPICFIPGGMKPAERRAWCEKQRELAVKNRDQDKQRQQQRMRDNEATWYEVGGLEGLKVEPKTYAPSDKHNKFKLPDFD